MDMTADALDRADATVRAIRDLAVRYLETSRERPATGADVERVTDLLGDLRGRVTRLERACLDLEIFPPDPIVHGHPFSADACTICHP